MLKIASLISNEGVTTQSQGDCIKTTVYCGNKSEQGLSTGGQRKQANEAKGRRQGI